MVRTRSSEEDYEDREEQEEDDEVEEKKLPLKDKIPEELTIPVTQIPDKEKMEIENYINIKRILNILSRR